MDGMLHQSLQLLMAARERVQPELAQSIVGALSEAQGYLAQAGKQVELVDRAASEAANLVRFSTKRHRLSTPTSPSCKVSSVLEEMPRRRLPAPGRPHRTRRPAPLLSTAPAIRNGRRR